MTLMGTSKRLPCVSNSLNGSGTLLATQGEWLRWLRNSVRLAQKPMAARAGIADGTLSEIENDLLNAKPEQLDCLHGAAMLEMAALLEAFAIIIREIQARRTA